MKRFRALVVAGALAMSFTFVGCLDHGGGDPCVSEHAMGSGATSIVVC